MPKPNEQPATVADAGDVRLSDRFYQECAEHPIPINLEAYNALRNAASVTIPPLASDER